MSRRGYLPGFVAAGLMALAATIAAGQRPLQPELKIPEQPPAAPMPLAIQTYPSVTAARLTRPEDGEWLMLRRTYDGWGYSPLAQINASNVSRLKPVWVMSTGVNNAHEAPPIVNGGVMFVALAHNQVMAIDVKSGTLLWRYRSEQVETRGKPVSRGVESNTSRSSRVGAWIRDPRSRTSIARLPVISPRCPKAGSYGSLL